jgi:hypothetical protein
MSLRGAISFLGDEWTRFHRMIEALEREAETHHKRHAEPASPKPLSSSRDRQSTPSPFSHTHSGNTSRWGL